MAVLFRKTSQTIANWEKEGLITNRAPKGKHPLYDPRDIYEDITEAEILHRLREATRIQQAREES